MKTPITVEYPTEYRKVLHTEAEMRALGYKNYKGDHTTSVFVNRPFSIKVRTSKVVDLDALCLAQTGMTPAEYQAKHGKAWNE